MVFFHPGHNFPLPTRNDVIIMEYLQKRESSHVWSLDTTLLQREEQERQAVSHGSLLRFHYTAQRTRTSSIIHVSE